MKDTAETPVLPTTEGVSERILQILTESAHLFAVKGYDGTSMSDIASACGISKSLLYHHFKSKDEIYSRISSGSTHQLYAYVAQRIPDGVPAAEKVRAFMLASAEYFDRYRWAWMTSSTTFWNDVKRSGQKERLMWRDRYEKLVRDLLEEAIEAGEIRPDIDVPITGRLVLSAINWMHRWYDPQKALSAPQIADIYFNVLFNGLKADAKSQSRQAMR